MLLGGNGLWRGRQRRHRRDLVRRKNAINGQVMSGLEDIFDDGTASGTIVDGASSVENVLAGGTALGTQVRNSGFIVVFGETGPDTGRDEFEGGST